MSSPVGLGWSKGLRPTELPNFLILGNNIFYFLQLFVKFNRLK